MKIEDIKSLLEEIEPDKEGNGYIDCGTGTEFVDCSRYRRIVTAIKQNIALQQENAELTKKLEEVEKQGMESLLKIETLTKKDNDLKQRFLTFMPELCEVLAKLKNTDFPIRIENFKFSIFEDKVVYDYDPIKEEEPIELKIKITENSNNKTKCPICGNPLGKYPAISREDNKTKICSNCGTLEALAAFKESIKDGKNEQQEV